MTAVARARESERPDRPKTAFVIRHRFVDDFLLGCAVEAMRQVVLVAAGLDTRAFRLAWPTGPRVFELDHRAGSQLAAPERFGPTRHDHHRHADRLTQHGPDDTGYGDWNELHERLE
jgi:hypothetical protein